MEKIIDKLILLIGGIVTLLGGYDVALKSLIIIIVIDYLTGICSAIYNKKLSSKVGLKGIIKKVAYLGVVALACVLDNLTGTNGIIRTLIIYFFIANDGLSIIENLAEMNIKLPKKLTEVLEQLKKDKGVR